MLNSLFYMAARVRDNVHDVATPASRRVGGSAMR